jgi:hypothetical protein
MVTAARIIPLVSLAVFMASCASPRADPPSRPPPSATLKIAGTISVNLPKRLAELGELPENFKGELSLDSRAETTAHDSRLSKYSGVVRLTLTNPAGDRTYFDYRTTVSGEIEGSPTSALMGFIGNAWRGAHAMVESITNAATRPATPDREQ